MTTITEKEFQRACQGHDRCGVCNEFKPLAIALLFWDEILEDRLPELYPNGKSEYVCFECAVNHDWIKLRPGYDRTGTRNSNEA